MTPTTAGCPGRYLPVSNRSAGICYGCARYGEPGEQSEPAASVDSSGTWGCQNRLAFGVVPEAPAPAPEGGAC